MRESGGGRAVQDNACVVPIIYICLGEERRQRLMMRGGGLVERYWMSGEYRASMLLDGAWHCLYHI